MTVRHSRCRRAVPIMAELIKRPERTALDKAIADALPLSGGTVRVALHKLQVELARLDDPQVLARQSDTHAHACVSCSPDGVLPGPGCGNCRQTGMDQTPCATPGHFRSCPHGCCGGPRKSSTAPNPSAVAE